MMTSPVAAAVMAVVGTPVAVAVVAVAMTLMAVAVIAVAHICKMARNVRRIGRPSHLHSSSPLSFV